MPIIRHDSPYYTPLSLPMWYLVNAIQLFVLGIFQISLMPLTRFGFCWNAADYIADLSDPYLTRFEQGMQKTVEESALNSPSEIDARAFLWTFDTLDEDHELERFFASLPGFRSSKVVEDPLPSFSKEVKRKLFGALTGLLDRTFSSDLLPEVVKNRRSMICAKAIDPAHIECNILHGIMSKYQYGGPLVADIVRTARGWGTSRDEDQPLVSGGLCN